MAALTHPYRVPANVTPQYEYTWETFDITLPTGSGGTNLVAAPGATKYVAIGYFNVGCSSTDFAFWNLHWTVADAEFFYGLTRHQCPTVFSSLKVPLVGTINAGVDFKETTSTGEVRITLAYCFLDTA